MNGSFAVQDAGLLPYADAWELQRREHARVASGGVPSLLLLEHPPVITLGRKAREGGNIVVTRGHLAKLGIEVFEVERGGDVTYHGPGQLVGYTIFPVGRRVRDFLRLIEASLVAALAELGLEARPNPGYAGVYVEPRPVNDRTLDQKIASIGVAVQRNVAFHGFALNVSTDLTHFEFIVPCGLQDTQMTSVAREYTLRGLSTPPDMGNVKEAVTAAFARTFETHDWSLPELAAQGASQ